MNNREVHITIVDEAATGKATDNDNLMALKHCH